MINYSVIIPHYNIPDLLMRCISSIPVRDDVQVIVVDDCSPQADKYKETYPELSRPYLEYYSTERGGSAGRARNVGLKHAKGKWLVFADSDDYFAQDFEKLLDEWKNDESDIVYFNVQCVDGRLSRLIEDENINSLRNAHPVPWGKFIKKSLVDSLQVEFDETRWSNDYFFSAAVGVNANQISICKDVLYYNLKRVGSLTDDFCKTDEEMMVRAKVGFRVQKLIDESPYRLSRPIIADDLLRLFFRNKKEFNIYFKKALDLGYAVDEMIRYMSVPCGYRDRIRLYGYVYLHFYLWTKD